MATPITDPDTLTRLRQLGNLWQQHGYCRIYFPHVPKLYGLRLQPYHPGSGEVPSLRGESLSDKDAEALLTALLAAKLYFNCDDGFFYGRGLTPQEFDILVAAILAKVASNS